MSPTARYWIRTVFGLQFWAILGGFLVATIIVVALKAQTVKPQPPRPVDCIIVKPSPACFVIEQAEYDKMALTAAQQKAVGGAMVPRPTGKLPPGKLYYTTFTGDLVPLTLVPGLWVDDTFDPSNPVVKVK